MLNLIHVIYFTSTITILGTEHIFLSSLEGPTCLPVLLHTVAGVVELCEGGGQLVEVVTQCVKQQIICDLLQNLREA